MKYKQLFFVFYLLVFISLTSCSKWFEFDFFRLKFGFVFTLILGLIGIIIMFFNGGHKKK